MQRCAKTLVIGARILAMVLVFSASLVGCASRDAAQANTADGPKQELVQERELSQKREQGMAQNVTMTVGNETIEVELAHNDTARAFAELLPVRLNMTELNGNEKYFYLDGALPSDAERVNTIHAGDLMLYGDSCVVLFYRDFSSSYSYTRIGRVVEAAGLAEAVGTGDVSVGLG